jgi:beta-glucosidase
MAGSNQISAEISNTGSRDGTEIAQLYLRDVIGSITRPVKQLKRFDRVFLRAGETKTVTFEISAEDLAFFGAEDRKLYEPGEFQVWIGPNSSDGVHGSFLFEM